MFLWKFDEGSYFCFPHPSFLLAFTSAAQLLPISVWNLPETHVKQMFGEEGTAGNERYFGYSELGNRDGSNYQQWRERTHLALCHVL
jgi:hypothetical protein